MEARKAKIMPIFEKELSEQGLPFPLSLVERSLSLSYMYEKWRMFYIMSSEAFGFRGGRVRLPYTVAPIDVLQREVPRHSPFAFSSFPSFPSFFRVFVPAFPHSFDLTFFRPDTFDQAWCVMYYTLEKRS